MMKNFIVILIVLLSLPLCNAIADYDSKGCRDPFIPLVGGERKSSTIGVASILTIDDVSLQGIVIDREGKKNAIINGEIMKQGQTIERVTVVDIQNNEVVIKIDEDEFTVKLYE